MIIKSDVKAPYFKFVIKFSLVYSPLLFLMSVVFPWEWLFKYYWVKEFCLFVAHYIPAVGKNLENSEFPEYSVVFLSFSYVLGLISLINFFDFRMDTKELLKHIEYKGMKDAFFKLVVSLICVMIVLYGFYWVGAITYFGCVDCSYNYELSLVLDFYVLLVALHFFLLGLSVFGNILIDRLMVYKKDFNND